MFLLILWWSAEPETWVWNSAWSLQFSKQLQEATCKLLAWFSSVWHLWKCAAVAENKQWDRRQCSCPAGTTQLLVAWAVSPWDLWSPFCLGTKSCPCSSSGTPVTTDTHPIVCHILVFQITGANYSRKWDQIMVQHFFQSNQELVGRHQLSLLSLRSGPFWWVAPKEMRRIAARAKGQFANHRVLAC